MISIMIRPTFFVGLFLSCSSQVLYSQEEPVELRLVSVPVANILKADGAVLAKNSAPVIHKKEVSALYTQALMGEYLEVVTQKEGWLYVRLCEQLHGLPEGQLLPCEGWIRKDQTTHVASREDPTLVVKKHNAVVYGKASSTSKKIVSLSCGTKLLARKYNHHWWHVALPSGSIGFIQVSDTTTLSPPVPQKEKKLRHDIVMVAKSMLGMPFCWYGRSSYNQSDKQQLTSVGCDGLIDLAYRACGIDIPRFAVDQYLFGEPIDGKNLQPGDLVFFGSPHRVPTCVPHHAMMYIGNHQLVEATFQSPTPRYPVVITSRSRQFGKPITSLRNGEIFQGKNFTYAVFFCRIIKPQSS